MTSITPEDIRALAPLFEAITTPDPTKQVQYDGLSGALLWRDELPEHLRPSRWWNIRPILSYRTGLIIGEPRADQEPLWLAARAAFPNWVGFRPERCRPDPELAQLYQTRRREFEDSWERMDKFA